MIVKEQTNFITIRAHGNDIAGSAHAAYWMTACEGEPAFGYEVQERHIVDAFKNIANLLGYRVEKIEDETPSASDPCPGIEIEPGVFSGCHGGTDCPVCHGLEAAE